METANIYLFKFGDVGHVVITNLILSLLMVKNEINGEFKDILTLLQLTLNNQHRGNKDQRGPVIPFNKLIK